MRALPFVVSAFVVPAFSALLAGPAAAQEAQPAAAADPTFVALQQRVDPDDKVQVTRLSGQTIKGKLVEVTDREVVVLSNWERVSIPAHDVQRVTRKRRGLVLGSVLGAGLGVATAVGVGAAFEAEPGDIGAMAAVYGLIGFGVGIGIDALVDIPRTVYERPRQAAVRVTPVVTRGGGGVQVGVTF